MHTSVHHHHEGTSETQGLILNWGWRYDLLVWALDTFLLRGKLRKFPQRTADLAQLQPGESVLDVGCGTGTLAIEAYRSVGATGHVYGIDPGNNQLARARAKARRAGFAIDFQPGVIERLPFADHSLDVVLSTFMMHHLTDDLKRVGLAEIRRVLKPEGRLVIVDAGQQNRAEKFGPGALDIQNVPKLLEEANFTQIESGDMQFPRVMGLDGVGFVKARTKG